MIRKVVKKEANVISYFLMASEWHPCLPEETFTYPVLPDKACSTVGKTAYLHSEVTILTEGFCSDLLLLQIC